MPAQTIDTHMQTVMLMQYPNKQSGAVLVMALVLLTVLTLIGLSTMSSSTSEMKIANNSQQHAMAFQAAQSRIDFASSAQQVSPVNFKINIPDLSNPATWPIQTCNDADGCPNGLDWNVTAVITYKGCATGFGNSLEGKAIALRTFDVAVDAATANGLGRSVQRQGVRAPVRSCGA
jgi:type IV pilus assembly protein PilX